jgi:hypothetical protein
MSIIKETIMALKIIGSGFGRTGTMSTKIALEQLGFGPCHHMIEVIGNPAQPPHWKAIAAGQAVDWAEVFDGYCSQVDFPGAAVWHQLVTAFPDARVVHTERPEEEWWASFDATIGRFFRNRENILLPPEVAGIFATMDDLLVQQTFAGRTDRDGAITAYRRNNQNVRDTIPAEQLLVFMPSEGWDPLCHFLGVPVPATPFPRSNARDEFWALFGGEPAVA